MSKQILMIHEFEKKFFDLNLENYILTFDDGLKSQFNHWEEIKKIKTKKIFFICPKFINDEVNDIGQKCMSISNIKQLLNEGCEIGGHSYTHKKINTFNRLNDVVNYIKRDTQDMLAWFDKNLQFKPKSFCFPYNDDFSGIYKIIVKSCGFEELYGRERVSVESLFPVKN